MKAKEELIRKYREYKEEHQQIPKYREFLKFSGTSKQDLVRLFGRNAYSKLQQECGDQANKLNLTRTPQEIIMRQYGNLALELKSLPLSPDWSGKGLKPSPAGLAKAPHFIPWSDFPKIFLKWVKSQNITGYEPVIRMIEGSSDQSKPELHDPEFEKLIENICAWSPARRRNNEEGYKVELRGHLAAIGHTVKEESGESHVDLFIDSKFVIELKKAPSLGEYDRLFGQLARHLQHQVRVIALIFDVPGEDNFDSFTSLVDLYLNKGTAAVEVIKK